MAEPELIFSKKILLKDTLNYKEQPGVIEITENKITNVKKLSLQSYQETIANEKRDKKTKIHDFGAMLITPAFINCHTHIAMNFFRAIINDRFKSKNLVENIFFKAESLLEAKDVRAFARIGAYENILNGNGLVWDHYYFANEIAEACIDVGITAVIAPTLQDISGPGTFSYKKALDETSEIHENKKYWSAGIFSAFGPHATDTVSKELWKKILAESQNLNIPIHCHVAQSYEEVKRIYEKYKKTPVSFLHSLGILQNSPASLLVHGIYLNSNDFKKINSKNNALVFCPFSQMIFQFPANILEWEKNKCKWFIATDCVASNDSMNLQKELRFIAGFPNLLNTFGSYENLLKKMNKKNEKQFLEEKKEAKLLAKKFSNSNFLLDKVFTLPGAFHPHFIAGNIKKGALANLIAWDLNHPSMWPSHNVTRNLSMGDTSGAIYNMCINGKWLGSNGHFSQSILNSDKYKLALYEANERLNSLLKKI